MLSSAEFTVDQYNMTIAAANERLANGPPITAATLAFELAAANASWKSFPVFEAVTFSGSTIAFERTSRIMYVRARGSVGTSATATAFAYTGTAPFQEGDVVHIKPYQAGEWLTLQLAGMISNLWMTQPNHFGTFVFIGGVWGLQASFPPILLGGLVLPPLRYVTTGASDIFLHGNSATITNLSAETPAGGMITVNTSGVSGSVTAYVDEGFGSFAIGTYAYSGSPTAAAVANGLVTDIHANFLALLHQYDSTLSGADEVLVEPPTGLGASANTYVLSSVDTGDAASVAVGFSGGVDGTDANASYDDILMPVTDGAVITIINGMSANTIAFTAAGNVSAAVTIPAKMAGMLIYSADLGKWSPLKYA